MKARFAERTVLTVILFVTLIVSVHGSPLSSFFCNASPVSCETPKVVLQSGTAGTSTIYINSTSAKVRIQPSWYNPSWNYRKRITVNHTRVQASLTAFPVLINLTSDSDLASHAQSNGNDILFASSDGVTKLSHEIEKYTSSTGALVAWVKIPSLSSSVDTDLYMYYGNPTCGSQQDATNVWDTNFKGVWHLKEDPSGTAPQMKDSTKANNGTSGGTMTSGDQLACKINGGLDFEGTDDNINCGDINAVDGATALTVSAWVKCLALDKDGMVLAKDTFAASSELLFWRDETTATGGRTDTLSAQVGTGSADARYYGSTGLLNDNNWHFVVMTYVGGSATGLRGYVDGAEDTAQSPVSTTSVPALRSTTNPVYIGRSQGGSPYFTGDIDEVRISSIARTATWISTEYNNQNSPSTFYSVGSNIQDFVDNNSSDVDTHTGHGTHSSFPAMQAGPDSTFDTLTETITSSTTANTQAFIGYRDSTTSLNNPKNRTWDGSAWGSQGMGSTTANPVRFVRVAYSPIEQRSFEKIVVTLSDDGYLDAYVWNGISWAYTSNIGSTGTTANAYKCFDLTYEKTTGRTLLVYSRGATSNEIGYNIWTYGSGWGGENLFDLTRTTGRVYWISLATASGARSGTGDDNEIALIYIDANVDVHGYVWTGSAWSEMGASAVWDSSAAIATEECIAVAYERTTGEALFIWADTTATDFYYKTWDGTTLSVNTLLDIPSAYDIGNWVTLKSDPASDDLFFTEVNPGFSATELSTAYWSGSAWTVHTEHDTGIDTNAQRCADFAWESTGGKGLLVYGTTADYITYRTFTAPNTWGSPTAVEMGSGGTHPWVQLRTNPRSISGDMKILGVVLEATYYDLGGIRWDGTTFTKISVNTFSADTTAVTYECFEMEFMNFGPPNYELDLEVQWTNVDCTQNHEELCIYGGVMGEENIRVDVWNGSSWVNFFADLNSGWKNISVSSYLSPPTFTIRFKGGNETGDTTQDSWNIDATLLHIWATETYDYVLKVKNNQVADAWKVSLKAYGSSNIARISSTTISFHDGTSSDQIIVSNGIITQSEGALYDLAVSATIYIKMSNVQAPTSGTSYIYVYLKVLVPSTSTYSLFIITFEIT